MSYKNEHFDHIFSRMRDSLPNNINFYYIIAIIKIAPLFLQVHSGGYTSKIDRYTTIHSYYKYFSLTFYIENSLDISKVIAIDVIILIINIVFMAILLKYIYISKKIQKIDDNYGSQNYQDCFFSVFSNLIFFKYILLCQFFYEINFLPLICIDSLRDTHKITGSNIFNSKIDLTSFTTVCTGSYFTIFIIISCTNMIIDILFYYILSSRFFDFNILSNFFWNTSENFLYSLLFLESLAQIFFIMFLNFDNKTYKLIFAIYVYVLFFSYLIRYIKRNEFYSLNTVYLTKILDVLRTMVIFAQLIVHIFQLTIDQSPNDMNIVGMIIIEVCAGVLKYSFIHRNDSKLVACVFTSNLNKLNESNIYQVFTYLITEFRNFSDVNKKFNDKNLDLFLENYVEHLKHCEDFFCPCKDYIKKVSNNSNTLKTGYQTSINFSHINGHVNKEEYILNKFFNVLSANVSTTIKYTNNNVNIINIENNNKQKINYNLRIRLIVAVKKLLSYKLEYLFNNLDGLYNNNFSNITKHFIRINFFSMQLLCNKSFYKTIFQYHEYLSEFHKKHGNIYKLFMIYYFYLKKFGIKEYNDLLLSIKAVKNEPSFYNLDFRKILSLCIKIYDIQERLVENVKQYLNFIEYFERDYVEFSILMNKVKLFKAGYKNLSKYIKHFFKHEKINNLFVTSKLILYYKILQFDIPEEMHNKLIVQRHDEDVMQTNEYIDTNYYLIVVYKDGEFLTKFISHELLIILEYSEEELRDQDFHILMPEKLRKLHKQLLIKEIKGRKNHNVTYKEIFFVSKKRTCILFDLHFKILLNLKAEITMLCVINIKRPKNDFRSCFICLDDEGQVLSMNKEFEQYFLLNMKILDIVSIDTEKVILQNKRNNIQTFFKDEENYNSEFFDKFDYDHYLSCLFGEEFEPLRDKNEPIYKKQYLRWQTLKEALNRGRSYNQFIDIYVRRRIINHFKVYFIKFLVRANLIPKMHEPYNTTLSLVNAVKISKKEMAKLSFYNLEEIYEGKSELTNEEKFHQSHDFLNESQSILSSAASYLKEKNSRRLFKTKKSRFKILPKSRNIMMLTFIIGSLFICLIIYNIVSIYIKENYINNIHDVMFLNIRIIILKDSLKFLSSGIIDLAFIRSQNQNYDNNLNNIDLSKLQSNGIHSLSFRENTNKIIKESIDVIVKTVYDINYFNNVYYNSDINTKISTMNNQFEFIYNNGIIYKKAISKNDIFKSDVITFKEISTFYESAYVFFKNSESPLPNFLNYIIFNKVSNRINSNIINLSNDDTFLFYLIQNYFTQIDPFLNELKNSYNNLYLDVESRTIYNFTIFKIFGFVIVIIIILIEFVFIYIGYEKAKLKMIKLKKQIQSNRVDLTLKKIEEFIKFCNTFNIYSLYIIADFELQKKSDEKVLLTKKTKKESSSTVLTLSKNLSESNNLLEKEEIKYKDKILNVNDEKTQVGKGLIKLEMLKNQKRKENIANIEEIEESGEIEKNFNYISSNNLIVPNEMNEESSKASKESDSNTIHSNSQLTKILPQNFSNKFYSSKFQSKLNEMINRRNSINSLSNNIKNYPRSRRTSFINENRKFSVINTFPSRKLKLRGILKNTGNGIGLNKNTDENSKIDDSNQALIINPNQDGVSMLKNRSKKQIRFNEKESRRLYLPEKSLYDDVAYSVFSPKENTQMKYDRIALEPLEIPIIIEGDSQQDSTIDREVNLIDKESVGVVPKLNTAVEYNQIISNNPQIQSINLSNFNEKKKRDEYLVTEMKLYYKNKSSNDKPVINSQKEFNINELKEMEVNEYKFLKDKNITTIKKKNSEGKFENEEIEQRIGQIVNTNFSTKFILFCFGSIFSLLYIVNIVININSLNKLSIININTNAIISKVEMINDLLLRYKLSLIRNNTKENLEVYFNNIYNNMKLITSSKQNDYLLPNVYTLLNSIDSEDTCKQLSVIFNQFYSVRGNSSVELIECELISNQLNKNGLVQAYLNIFNSINYLFTDMTLLNDLSEKSLLTKLSDPSLFNITAAIDYTFYKYQKVLLNYTFADLERYFSMIKATEDVYLYCSIIFEIVFFIVAITCIIFPIKYVEMLICWLIHKLNKKP